jgi:CRISPR-associated protein Cas5d
MTNQRSKRYFLRVWGDLACFTSPSKVERDSYPVITPSAARGLFDAILWKPAIRWVIHTVYVVNPIKYMTIRRNELKERPDEFGHADRDLRTTRALRNVEYIIEASFYMTDRAGDTDSLVKFHDMFERRVSKGQSFRDPYFGCREFPAYFEMFTGDPLTKANPYVDNYIGAMVHDFESSKSNRFRMFDADVVKGVLQIPSELWECAVC